MPFELLGEPYKLCGGGGGQNSNTVAGFHVVEPAVAKRWRGWAKPKAHVDVCIYEYIYIYIYIHIPRESMKDGK